MDINQYISVAQRSPRLTTLFDQFSRLADGSMGAPRVSPLGIDGTLVRNDALTLHFHKHYSRLAGTFTAHFAASVPYAVEEECRVGTAIWLSVVGFPKRKIRPLTLYTLGSAEGVIARTVASLSRGAVRSISCSPNVENYREFFRKGAPPSAKFFHGPFFDLIRQIASGDPAYAEFRSGFDFIIEDTTFQMYSKERRAPLSLISTVLKDDGLLLLVEKLRHKDPLEYARREEQKDLSHKSRYFLADEVEAKRKSILTMMYRRQVTLESLCSDLKSIFAHCALLWNSGNFYCLAASHSADAIARFVRLLTPPNVPPSFCYEKIPRRLFGLRRVGLSFRDPIKLGENSWVDSLCQD